MIATMMILLLAMVVTPGFADPIQDELNTMQKMQSVLDNLNSNNEKIQESIGRNLQDEELRKQTEEANRKLREQSDELKSGRKRNQHRRQSN